MSVQVAPPFVVTSRNPPAPPTAMWFRSIGLTPRSSGAERKVRFAGRPGLTGAKRADPINCQVKPPFVVFHTRVFEKWKNTRPVGSRFAGAEMTAVKTPNALPDSPAVADDQFWNTGGSTLPVTFVRIFEPCELPSTVAVFAWLNAAP